MTKTFAKLFILAAVFMSSASVYANLPSEEQVRADATGNVYSADASLATDRRIANEVESAPRPMDPPPAAVSNDREGADFAVLLD